MVCSSFGRHRSQHAERDRRRSTGPVHPKGVTGTCQRPSGHYAMRSRTIGFGVNSVPGAAMSQAEPRDCRA
ncbi:hypothetical protein DEJ44_21830 [Streptomyces venezuelae]|nr:hypothetical protein DEJ44_21830 [Streptomyces venezuelae]